MSPDETEETAAPSVFSASFVGRIGRLRYLAYSWPAMALSGLGILAAVIIPKARGMTEPHEPMLLPVAIAVVLVLWLWTMLRLMALRLHDVNRSAKWIIALLLLPGLGAAISGPQVAPAYASIFWIVSLLLILVPGSESDNDYGPPTGPNTPSIKVGASIVVALLALGVFGNIQYMHYARAAKLDPSPSKGVDAAPQQPAFINAQSPKEVTLAALRKSVQEMSPTLPRKIDRVTTLTDAEVIGDVYRIYYSMDPTLQLDARAKDSVAQVAKQQICRGATRSVIDSGISVEYRYSFSGSAGAQTLLVAVPAGSCN